MSAKHFVKISSVLLMVLFFALPGRGFSQDEPAKSKKSKDPKDQPIKGTPAKIIQQGDALFALRNFTEASRYYREALKKEPNNFGATFKVARCEKQLQNYEEATRYYESAKSLDANANDTLYFEVGTCYRMLDRQNDALEVFQEFKKRYPLKDEYSKRVSLEIEGCKMVLAEKEKIPDYVVSQVNFNTPAGDMFPSILNQNKSDSFVVFTSYRTEALGNKAYSGLNEADFSDLFIVKIEDDTTFGVPENLGKKINTKYNDGSSTFTPDGLTMYYSICNNTKLGYGCVIYKSVYDPDKKGWGKREAVEALKGQKEVVINSRGKTKNVPTIDIQPSISPDGNTMYFVSNREGGWGRFDVWFSTLDGDEWSEPVNAGPLVNTPFDDRSPFQSRNGNFFYFSSDGHKGYGGSDIFRIEGSGGNYKDKTLMNMGAPINSSYDDYGPAWYKQDSICLFTSNRKGGEGRADIYYAKRKPQDPIEVAVHGKIRDKKTRQAVPFAVALLFVIDPDNPEILIPLDTFVTDQNADYTFQLKPNKRYKIVANAPEYLANEENFDTKGMKPGKNDIEKNIDIFIERIIIGLPIVLNNIYYDFDKAELRPESQAELDALLKTLTDNPQIVIRVGSHTDSNGSEKYNKDLSERRAKSVMEYLISKNTDPARLEWFGYGESTLMIYPELSDEDEQLNRRSEFRITSFNFNQPK